MEAAITVKRILSLESKNDAGTTVIRMDASVANME